MNKPVGTTKTGAKLSSAANSRSLIAVLSAISEVKNFYDTGKGF